MNSIPSFFDPEAAALLERRLAQRPHHGDQPRWQAALDELPAVDKRWQIENGVLVAGGDAEECARLTETLKVLIPWRKGPLKLGGAPIDTEWRSDWKWDRVAPHVDLSGKRVLDIGAGNGYFGWRMLAAGADAVIGCDPSLLFWHQHRVIEHFAGTAPHLLLPLKFEDLPIAADFDVVFSMGVLYHRKDPAEHLDRIRRHLRPRGTAVIETLIIPGEADEELDPPGRYANMPNVHHLPTKARLLRWLNDTGFADSQVVNVTATAPDEQRRTAWMPFHSLAEALEPDLAATREGHPAPLRAVVVAVRRV